MKPIRHTLTSFLLVAAFLLSFDALTHKVEGSGVIRAGLFFGVVSVHLLSQVWAASIDTLICVGILGVRLDPRDWRAWAAMAMGITFSFGFQITGLDNWLARFMAAVPPMALTMAIIVLEIPRGAPTSRSVVTDTPTPKDYRGEPIHVVADSMTPKEAVAAANPTATPLSPSGLTPADKEALRRARGNPFKVGRAVGERGLDHETVAQFLGTTVEAVEAMVDEYQEDAA